MIPGSGKSDLAKTPDLHGSRKVVAQLLGRHGAGLVSNDSEEALHLIGSKRARINDDVRAIFQPRHDVIDDERKVLGEQIDGLECRSGKAFHLIGNTNTQPYNRKND